MCIRDSGKAVANAGGTKIDLGGAAKGYALDLLAQNLSDNHVSSAIQDVYKRQPIPMVYCDKCGEVPVPESQLPVELPYDVNLSLIHISRAVPR